MRTKYEVRSTKYEVRSTKYEVAQTILSLISILYIYIYTLNIRTKI